MPTRAFAATTSTLQLAPHNPRRRVLSIYNNGVDVVFFSQDQGNLPAGGYPIQPGTQVTMNRRDGDEPELNIYVQANTGTQNMRVFEGFGEPEQATGSEPGAHGPLG